MRYAIGLISSVMAALILSGCGGGGGSDSSTTPTGVATATFIDSPYPDWNLKVPHKKGSRTDMGISPTKRGRALPSTSEICMSEPPSLKTGK